MLANQDKHCCNGAVMTLPDMQTNGRSTSALRRLTQVAFLFPGASSAYVGMLQPVRHLAAVQKMLLIARRVLGVDLLDVCRRGPAERLALPEHSHPVSRSQLTMEPLC